MGIRQSGNKRVFVVQPALIYHIERSDVSGVRDLPEEAMTDSPKTGPPASTIGLQPFRIDVAAEQIGAHTLMRSRAGNN
jgi:hypothetical protein